MDRQSPERTSHPNSRAERIDLLEVAWDFLGTVEFAADIREASSRYRRSLCLAGDPEVGLSMTTRAFVGTNPTDESIVSGLLVRSSKLPARVTLASLCWPSIGPL